MKYSELPFSYKLLAKQRAYTEPDNFTGYCYKNMIKENSVGYGFNWKETPEGHRFWEAVHRANSNQQLPPLHKYAFPRRRYE